MAIGLGISAKVDGLEKLKEYVEYVEKLVLMKTSKDFQEYIQNKCLKTVLEVANQRIDMYQTTNEDMKGAYLRNNKIRKTNDGFIIYNDLTIEKKASHHSDGYTFSVALAFEYGTGLIGEQQAINGAWKYNINENTVLFDGETIDGWWIPKSKAGGTETFGESKNGQAVITRGYQGMEIYRYSAEEIKKNLKKWIKEYRKNGGVSQ